MYVSYQLRMQTYRLCNRIGLRSHSSRAPARHLDAQHPQVEAVKTFVAKCEGPPHYINKRLIANFDQVWTTTYNHSKRVLHKPEEDKGKHNEKHSVSMQRMMKSIKQALMIEPPDDNDDSSAYQPKRIVLDAQANVSPIEGWRDPRTTTTLSWSDGELGASWVTVKEGAAPIELINDLNKEMSGLLFIQPQDSKTHMWNASTMLHYLKFLSVQLRLKRIKHGLTTKDRGLIFCDKAAVHACEAFSQLRERWEQENHAIICHGGTSETIRVPPGWGATGAPNDGFHQYFHLLRQSYQKVASGQGRFLKLRAALEELSLAVDGSVRFKPLVSKNMVLLLLFFFKCLCVCLCFFHI